MSTHTKGTLACKKLGVIVGGPIHEFTNGSGQSQLFMATGGHDLHHTEVQANAERVVLCWNMHDDLVKVLTELRDAAMQDCEQSDASAERYADILNRVDVVVRKAGAQ